MTKVIDFGSSSAAKSKKLLEDKNKEIESLKKELREANNKIGELISINEMLKLQLTDLLNNLSFFQNHLQSFGHNAKKLKDKLPDLSKYGKNAVVQIKHEDGSPINLLDNELDNKDDDQ